MAKAGRRAATTPDDERDEGVAASLKGLDDDTVLIVTSFLPECRDVLSLSVTRALPETAWRAAHKSLLPGLHVARRRNEGQGKYWWCAMPDFYACGVADGPKSWRERFADGARLLSSDAAPTVVETEIQTLMESFGRVEEGRTWWSLACLREDGAALILNKAPPEVEETETSTNRRYQIHWWTLEPDGSFNRSDPAQDSAPRRGTGRGRRVRATVAGRSDARRRRRHFRPRPGSPRRGSRGVAGDARRPAPRHVYQMRLVLSLRHVHGGQPSRQLPTTSGRGAVALH